MGSESRYLLVTSCSERKRIDSGLMPAIKRYNGINFLIINKAKREGYFPKNLDIIILSAKYGLIESETQIENYNLRMTHAQALKMAPKIAPQLAERVKSKKYSEIFLIMGKNYRIAIHDWDLTISNSVQVTYASGGIGQRGSQLRHWLMEKWGLNNG